MESFETDPKNAILANFGQNDGLAWPNLGQICKKTNWCYFSSESGIFKIWSFFTQILLFGYLAKLASLQI